MTDIISLSELKKLPVAHTDAGDFLFLDVPRNEFYVKGKIKKARAGLFFLDIDGESFTIHKQDGFEVGEEVICIINPLIKNDCEREFIVRSLEHLD